MLTCIERPFPKKQSSNAFQLHAQINDYVIMDSNKIFKPKYVVYSFNIITSYTKWEISYRYSDFLSLHDTLTRNNVGNLPSFPPKIYLGLSVSDIAERFRQLERYINEIFKQINIINYPDLVCFFQVPNEVITLYYDKLALSKGENEQLLHSSSFITFKNSFIRTRSSTNSKNDISINGNSKEGSMGSNYYNNLHQFKMHDNNVNISNEKSPNALVVEEFLRNLQDNKENKSEIIHNFELFLKNTNNNWPYFRKKEIQYFFNGMLLDQTTSTNTEDVIYINSFLFHIGNVQNNILGSQKSLELLNKLVSFDFNPQYEEFIEEFKRTPIEKIISMELEKHILSKFPNIQKAAFNVLNILVGESRHIIQKTKRILNCKEAERKFLNWIENQKNEEF